MLKVTSETTKALFRISHMVIILNGRDPVDEWKVNAFPQNLNPFCICSCAMEEQSSTTGLPELWCEQKLLVKTPQPFGLKTTFESTTKPDAVTNDFVASNYSFQYSLRLKAEFNEKRPRKQRFEQSSLAMLNPIWNGVQKSRFFEIIQNFCGDNAQKEEASWWKQQANKKKGLSDYVFALDSQWSHRIKDASEFIKLSATFSLLL